jgi:hypothetical protein
MKKILLAILFAAGPAMAGNVPAKQGGMQSNNPAAHTVPVMEGTSAPIFAAPATAGYPFISNGASSDPSFSQLPIAGISATGTASSTTYLRGDGSWSTPAGGGGLTIGSTSIASGSANYILTVNGAGTTLANTSLATLMATPPTIGGTTPGIAYFTTLSSISTVVVSGGETSANSGAWLYASRSGAMSSATGEPMGAPVSSNALSIQDWETVGPTGAGAATSYQSNALDVYKNFSVGNGPRTGIQSTVFQSAATAGNTTASGSYTSWYTGIFSNIRAYVNDGGTSTSAQKGQYEAMAAIAQSYSGATNLVGLVGAEYDVLAGTGSSMGIKVGVQVISGTGATPGDAVHGNYRDAGFFEGSATTSDVGFNYGMQFGGGNTSWPVTSTGTIIGAVASNTTDTAAIGLDFSAVTFSSYAIHTPGFTIGSAGAIGSTGLPTSGTHAGSICTNSSGAFYQVAGNCYVQTTYPGATSATVAASTTTYLGANGAQSTVAATYWASGQTYSSAKISIATSTAPGASQTYTYTLYDGGTSTGISCTISGGAAFSCTASGAYAISQYDALYIQVTTSAGATAGYHRYALEMDY